MKNNDIRNFDGVDYSSVRASLCFFVLSRILSIICSRYHLLSVKVSDTKRVGNRKEGYR